MRVRDIILKADKKKIGSKAIAEITKSDYSHTAVLTENNEVIEAEFPRVICTGFDKWKLKNKYREYYFSDWYDCNINLKLLIGKNYELGRFVNYLLYKLTGSKWFINRDNAKNYVCSEINGLCRGLPNPHLLVPQDFVKFIKKS
jgi:hypothetical protein